MGKNQRYYKIKDKKLTKNKKNAKLNKSMAFALSGIATIGAASLIAGTAQDAQAMMGKPGTGVVSTKFSPSIKPGVKPAPGLKVTTSRGLNGAPGAINSGRLGNDGTMFKGMNQGGGIKGVKTTNGLKNTGIKTGAATGGLKTDGIKTGGATGGTSGGILKTNGMKGAHGDKHVNFAPGTTQIPDAPPLPQQSTKPTLTTNTGAGAGASGVTLKAPQIPDAPPLPQQSTKPTLTANKGTGAGASGVTLSTGTGSATTSTSGVSGGKLSYKGNVREKAGMYSGGNASNVQLKDGALNQKAFNQSGNKGGPVLTTEGFYRK